MSRDDDFAEHRQPALADSVDQPLDAIVLDVHPAFLPNDYPYGPRTAGLPRPTSESLSLPDLNGVVGSLARAADYYFAVLNRPPDFVVPKTFGMSAILGIMTALAVVFACLRWLDVWPVFYFFYSALALVICMAQMFYGKTPRVASIVAGAILLPVFTLGAALLDDDPSPAYITGTCAAGVFLVMDYLEPYLQGRGTIRRDQTIPG